MVISIECRKIMESEKGVVRMIMMMMVVMMMATPF